VNPLGRAYATLGWAGLLLTVGLILLERAQSDVDRARDLVRDERAKRIAAEDQAEKALRDLDEATAPPETE
jgi:hypothetical protein